jgi:rubredoxin
MAEVKTYKCDICGNVYHVDDGDEKLMTINYKVDSENEGKFEHICDECMGMIHACLRDPDILDDNKKELDKVREEKGKLKSCIKELYRFIDPNNVWRNTFIFSKDPDEMTTEIIDEFEELEKSRRVWRIVASMGIGAFIGNMLALLLKLFA